MSLERLRPQVGEMEYHLFRTPVHPEFFRFLKTGSIEHQGLTVRTHLCPDGHVIEASRRRRRLLTEVVSSSGSELPANGRLVSHRIGGQKHFTQQLDNGLLVHACFQMERLSVEAFTYHHQELWTDAARAPLSVHLAGEQFGIDNPLGFAEFHPSGRYLSIHTWHTFPHEHAVLKTQTLIEA